MKEQIKFKPRSLGWTTIHAADLAAASPPAFIYRVHLADRVNCVRQEAIRQGLPATELWLGPKEYAEFESETRGHCTFPVTEDMLRGEAPIWMGLIVRKGIAPGVRVGSTVGDEQSPPL